MINSIDAQSCTGCGSCVRACPLDALRIGQDGKACIAYPDDCMTCYLCERACPSGAIDVHPFREALPTVFPGMATPPLCTIPVPEVPHGANVPARAPRGEDSETIEADVLIVGSGSAGLWTASRFTELMPQARVVIVDKGPRDWGGLMAMAGGDFDAVLPGENVDDWLRDMVYYFDGLCDQEQMETLLSRSYDRLCDYQRLGCEFLTLPDGRLRGVPQRGLPHVKLYPARLKGRGGENMVRSLVGILKERAVRRIGRFLVTNILHSDGRIAGACGFDTVTGAWRVIRARAVVLATGMGGWKTSYGKNTPTGEGMLLGYGEGAVLKDLEFARVWNMPRHFGWEGQTTLMPLGARFVNSRGENFMERYSPVLGPNTDPHYTTIAMAMEVRAGRGPITFDLSRIDPSAMDVLRPQNGWQKLNHDKLRDLGLDLFRDATEWVPQMTVAYGGMDADVMGRTCVPGLFATGTARSTEPGVYAGGFALMSTSVSGHLTGEALAEFLLQDSPAPVSRGLDEDVEALRAAVFAPLGGEDRPAKEAVTAIQAAMFPYDVSIIKNAAGLSRAIDEIARIKAEILPTLRAKDAHGLLKLRETFSMAFVSELYLKASLLRDETRAGHYREDHPTRRDDRLAWLVASKGEDGAPDFQWRRVPVERYRIPVERFYQDNFNFSEE